MPEPILYQTLSGMLAPALFMTATGSLLITANNRLARVMDRLRVLVDMLDRLGQRTLIADFPEEREEKLLADVARSNVRGARLLRAIGRLYLAFACFVGTSLMLAVDSLTDHALAAVPTGLAVVGVSLLLFACLNLFLEARSGLATLDKEVAFMASLREKRRPATPSGPTTTQPP
jgi:hypothetical protein